MLVLVQCVNCNRWFATAQKSCVCEKHELLFRAKKPNGKIVFVFVTERFSNGSIKQVLIELYTKSTNRFSVEENLINHGLMAVESMGNWIERECF